MEDIPVPFKKWIAQCVIEEFGNIIEKYVGKEEQSQKIAERVIRSRKMVHLVAGVKEVLADHIQTSANNSCTLNQSQGSYCMSFGSELYPDDWEPLKNNPVDPYDYIIEKIQRHQPVHVRLAGFEALIKSDLSSIAASPSLNFILQCLRGGIANESRAIFSISLESFARLLNVSRSYEQVHTSLLAAYEALWHSKTSQGVPPTFTSGINFKIFLHEKLFSVMNLLIQRYEEIVKILRISDKHLENAIESFVTLMSSCSRTPRESRTMTTANVISVLDPKSDWSRQWMHNLSTSKMMVAALRKTTFLENVVNVVRVGLENPPSSLNAYITNDISGVYISGETVRTTTYLNSLCFVTHLSSKATGRRLLTELPLYKPWSFPEFMLSLLNSLNNLVAVEKPSNIYVLSRVALRSLLEASEPLYDARFHRVATNPLLSTMAEERKVYPHMIDVMLKMLDTEEGTTFIVEPFQRGLKGDDGPMLSPAHCILEYVSMLLRQPFLLMDVHHLIEMFKFVARLFESYQVCQVVRDTLIRQFYPAITYFYNKIDKYSIENENKTRLLDSTMKSMLMKVVSIPMGLILLAREELVFEELLRGALEPLRFSWNCNDIVGFVSTAALLPLGFEILSDLAPNFLAKILIDVYQILENPNKFHDPWAETNIKDFLHVLALLSMNCDCFVNVLDTTNDDSYPYSLYNLLRHLETPESPYHCLALRALTVFNRNLNGHIYLQNRLNIKEILLNLQESFIIQEETVDGRRTVYIIDEGSSMRNEILLYSYYIGQRVADYMEVAEQFTLFAKLPPPEEFNSVIKLCPKPTSDSELEKFLSTSQPGLKDIGWVCQARNAHKSSSELNMKHSLIISLLDEMQKGIPVFEMTRRYEWPLVHDHDQDTLFPEEILGIEYALLYAEQNCLMQSTPIAKSNLKIFLRECHAFMQSIQPKKFEGFDWFAATIFIICGGNLEKCKSFVIKVVQFPSIIYVWSTLGRAVSREYGTPATIEINFAQILESIIAVELPDLKYVLKSNCGVDWWMICNGIISHFFWGILPWGEIIHLLAICILYPPDYLLYYCVSLLYHSKNRLMDDVTTGKMWPENLNLSDFRCCSHFQFIDQLTKRHRDMILPMFVIHETEEVMWQ